MSDKDNMDWIDGLDVSPIMPSKRSKQNVSHSSPGYKFYIKIKENIPELWDEFNSAQSKGKAKYKTVRSFAKVKFKKKDENKLFILMTCTEEEWESHVTTEKGRSDKHVCPWLGNWDARRKNGYWQDSTVHASYLKAALKETVESSQAIKATAPFLVQEMMRYNRLISKIETAFGGEPFLDDIPNSPKNKSRFDAYVDMLTKATNMKLKLVQEWMRIHGVDPLAPNEMFNPGVFAQLGGQIGAAGALTGYAAAQGFALQNPEGPPTILNRNALLLADHLVQHSEKYKDEVLDGQEVVARQDEVKTNGKVKHAN